MRLRRIAREKALQFLFQHEVNPLESLGRALDAFWADQFGVMREERGSKAAGTEGSDAGGNAVPTSSSSESTAASSSESASGASADSGPTTDEAAIRLFADGLVHGTLRHLTEIDAELARVMINWSLHRLAAVDRNLLRMAVYELRYRDDIPPVVTINEAIDIARKFSTADSGKFVNGILDRIKGELSRPAREPAGA